MSLTFLNREDGGGSLAAAALTVFIFMIHKTSQLVKASFGLDGEDGTIP